MKTGFLYGGARTPRYVYYFYHGKIMQCRKEPWIPPYIYYDTHPAEYPPNYYYECDTMPDGATPPMSPDHFGFVTQTTSGGLFDLRTHYSPYNTAAFASYYWRIIPTAKLEIIASFPTLEVIDPGYGWISGEIYINSRYDIGVGAYRDFGRSGGHTYLSKEYTRIFKTDYIYFDRPFTNNIHIIVEKILGQNKWNFYFNDEWIFDITSPSIKKTSFWIIGPSSEYGHGTMDYIRVWKDKERY